jgi:hypothetical protein
MVWSDVFATGHIRRFIVTSMPGSSHSIGQARLIRAVHSGSGDSQAGERNGGLRFANPPYALSRHLPLTDCVDGSCCDIKRVLPSWSNSPTRFAAAVMAPATAL